MVALSAAACRGSKVDTCPVGWCPEAISRLREDGTVSLGYSARRTRFISPPPPFLFSRLVFCKPHPPTTFLESPFFPLKVFCSAAHPSSLGDATRLHSWGGRFALPQSLGLVNHPA